MEAPIIGRFAPTPSGRMHLGNVFAALMAWLSVKSRGGAMVLRMEDLDTQRTSEEFAEILRSDLRWLGLDWDDETPPQSQRSKVYDRYTPATAPAVSSTASMLPICPTAPTSTPAPAGI